MVGYIPARVYRARDGQLINPHLRKKTGDTYQERALRVAIYARVMEAKHFAIRTDRAWCIYATSNPKISEPVKAGLTEAQMFMWLMHRGISDGPV